MVGHCPLPGRETQLSAHGVLERCREYVREKQRGSREVLIEERTQKEKRRGSRERECVCVPAHTCVSVV